MNRLAAVLVLVLSANPATAEVFTWTDADGVRHYGERPPPEVDARPLSLDQQSVSTVGDSGLRPAERELLQAIDEARATQAPPPPAPLVLRNPEPEPPPSRIIYTTGYPVVPYNYSRSYSGYSFGLRFHYGRPVRSLHDDHPHGHRPRPDGRPPRRPHTERPSRSPVLAIPPALQAPIAEPDPTRR